MADLLRTYTVKKVSEELDCSPDTVRRYTKEFADFLSESAQAGGGTRLFTDEDIWYLRQARLHLLEGHTYDQAREFLSALEPPQDAGEANLDQARTDLATTAAFQQLTAALYQLADTRDRTDLMESRLDALSESRIQQEVTQSEIQRQLEQIARNQEQLAKATSRPLFWAIVGAFVSAIVVLAGVLIALQLGWIG